MARMKMGPRMNLEVFENGGGSKSLKDHMEEAYPAHLHIYQYC
jgi:hypothetical protein